MIYRIPTIVIKLCTLLIGTTTVATSENERESIKLFNLFSLIQNKYKIIYKLTKN